MTNIWILKKRLKYLSIRKKEARKKNEKTLLRFIERKQKELRFEIKQMKLERKKK